MPNFFDVDTSVMLDVWRGQIFPDLWSYITFVYFMKNYSFQQMTDGTIMSILLQYWPLHITHVPPNVTRVLILKIEYQTLECINMLFKPYEVSQEL